MEKYDNWFSRTKDIIPSVKCNLFSCQNMALTLPTMQLNHRLFWDLGVSWGARLKQKWGHARDGQVRLYVSNFAHRNIFIYHTCSLNLQPFSGKFQICQSFCSSLWSYKTQSKRKNILHLPFSYQLNSIMTSFLTFRTFRVNDPPCGIMGWL